MSHISSFMCFVLCPVFSRFLFLVSVLRIHKWGRVSKFLMRGVCVSLTPRFRSRLHVCISRFIIHVLCFVPHVLSFMSAGFCFLVSGLSQGGGINVVDVGRLRELSTPFALFSNDSIFMVLSGFLFHPGGNPGAN